SRAHVAKQPEDVAQPPWLRRPSSRGREGMAAVPSRPRHALLTHGHGRLLLHQLLQHHKRDARATPATVDSGAPGSSSTTVCAPRGSSAKHIWRKPSGARTARTVPCASGGTSSNKKPPPPAPVILPP